MKYRSLPSLTFVMAKIVENYSKILNNLEANIAFFIFLQTVQREISRRLGPVYSREQRHNEAECARRMSLSSTQVTAVYCGSLLTWRFVPKPGQNYYKLCAIVAGEKKRNITELLPWRMSWIFNGGTFKMLLKWVEKFPVGVEKDNLEAYGFRTCKCIPNFIRLNFFFCSGCFL